MQRFDKNILISRLILNTLPHNAVHRKNKSQSIIIKQNKERLWGFFFHNEAKCSIHLNPRVLSRVSFLSHPAPLHPAYAQSFVHIVDKLWNCQSNNLYRGTQQKNINIHVSLVISFSNSLIIGKS